jgi:UDP-glucose 4-epimerase
LSTWLVTGGAGYIGAHVVKNLLEHNLNVVVVDDLSTGNKSKLSSNVNFYQFDIAQTDSLSKVMRENKVDGVIHLAAKKAVGESVLNPSLYYKENIGGLISLLEAMNNANVKKIVYSSSAAVYGSSQENKVKEDSETNPSSPYGETKLVGEWLLKADQSARNLQWVALRYFNVVGAGSNELGDSGVNNLVPMVFRALAKKQRPQIFGDDYQTKDGTCIRDYIHVNDLAAVHQVAAQKLMQENYCGVLNVGRGQGFSVKEVLQTIEKVIGQDLNYEIVGRRSGDPSQTVADVTKSFKDLGWKANLDLFAMVESAWAAWQTIPPNKI